MTPDKCPKCGDPEGVIIREEVDIGVGIQEHILSSDCPTCGQHSVCDRCGYWDWQGHAGYCAELNLDSD